MSISAHDIYAVLGAMVLAGIGGELFLKGVLGGGQRAARGETACGDKPRRTYRAAGNWWWRGRPDTDSRSRRRYRSRPRLPAAGGLSNFIFATVTAGRTL
ncbi:MAG: hypothetical protein Q8N33_03195 [Rhodocyclaceae bacterium]|nr:hypothetical protein [Rhodocyclaceae bacterium]